MELAVGYDLDEDDKLACHGLLTLALTLMLQVMY